MRSARAGGALLSVFCCIVLLGAMGPITREYLQRATPDAAAPQPPPNSAALSVILVPPAGRPELRDGAIGSASNGVLFDLTGHGERRRVSWPTTEAALSFLGVDRNGNGVIDSATELFSNRMLPGVTGAFTALIQFGGPQAVGALTSGDPLFHKLWLWEDRNRDGKSEPSELRNASTRFAKIGLGYSALNEKNGTPAVNKGWAVAIADLRNTPEDRLTPLYEVRLQILH